jgi:acyl-homoserine lactone acylase PvdQ
VAADAADVHGAGESIDWLWRSGARAARIAALLARAAQHGPMSLRQVADLQSDVGEERAQRIAALATGLVRDTELGPQAKEVVRLLQNWDGLASADSAGAAMYHVFLAKLLDSLLKDRVAGLLAPFAVP